MKKTIINKILYTVGNDLALFCLLVAVYYLPRIIPYNLALILLIIVFITAVFCFYLVRVFTVIGDIYDEDYNAVYVLFKIFVPEFICPVCVFLHRPSSHLSSSESTRSSYRGHSIYASFN